MAEKVKGIVIEIGGDTKGLSAALSKVDKETKSMQKELTTVNRLLKLDPKNTELLAQKQKLLSESVKATEDKLTALKNAKEKADADMKSGTEINEKQYRQLQREIISTEDRLKQLKVETNKFAQAGKELESVGKKLTDAGKKGMAVTGVIAGIGTAAASAAEGTREYREDINRLSTAFETAGHGTASAKTTYEEFYKILGESDRAVEAVNHLALLCNNEKEFTRWTDIAAGVAATFGDSLPIEGLTEAANETAKVSKVTGPLADALNWVGISEDAFNEKLAACRSEQERSTLITNTLSEAYQNAAVKFRESNAEVMNHREAQQRLNDEIARIGKFVEPIITMLIGKVAELLKWFNDLNSGQKTAIATIGAIIAIIPPLLILIGQMTTGIGAVMTAWAKYNTAAKAVNATHIAMKLLSPAGILTALTAALGIATVAVLTHKTAAEKIMDTYEKQIESIDAATSAELEQAVQAEALKNKLFELEDQINSGTLSEKEATKVKEQFNNVSNQLNNIIPGIIDNVGNETSAYSVQRGEVDALTQSFYDLAYAKAMAAAYEEKIKETAKALLDVDEAIKPYDTGEKDKSHYSRFLGMEIPDYEYQRLQDTKKTLTDAMNEYITEISKLETEAMKERELNLGNHTGTLTGIVETGAKDQAAAKEEQYEKELRDLKYSHEMGKISEAEYYKKLAEYRDTYFESGSSEWQSYTLEIHNYIEGQKQEIQDMYDEIAENALSKIEEVEDAQKSFADKLKGYGNLYTLKTDTITYNKEVDGKMQSVTETNSYVKLADLSESINTLNEYKNTLSAIRAKGVPQGFFEILRGLSIEDGIAFGKELLSISDDEFSSYIGKWEEYQRLSDDVSKTLYSGEVNALKNEIEGQFSEMSDNFEEYGIDSADEWCSGFMQKITAMQEKIKNALQSITASPLTALPSAGGGRSSLTIDNSRTRNTKINISGGTDSSAYEIKQQVERLLTRIELEGR